MTERLAPQPWMDAAPTRAVMAALAAAGGEGCARFVGGCVRDALVGRPVSDIDIATPLAPTEVIAALEAAGLRAVPTGIEHGTVTAVAAHKPFEITTLRRDVETDGRRAVVVFTPDWAEDAARRDFRLNALYLEPDGTLHDPVGGGVADARAGRVVFVGEPEARIREDYLRILRFFRFRAWYGRGEPDAAALAACAAMKGGVAGLSGERVSKELLKLLSAPDPVPAVGLMAEAGVLEAALQAPVDLALFRSMAALTGDAELRLSALTPPGSAAAVAKRLRLSNAQRDRLAAAIGTEPPLGLGMGDAEARRALYRLGAATFGDRIRRLWAAAPEKGEDARRLLAVAEAWTRPRFPLSGADVMGLGAPRGPEVGRLLQAAEAWWIEADFRPGREEALAKLRELAGTR